jgi:hypothetical protein
MPAKKKLLPRPCICGLPNGSARILVYEGGIYFEIKHYVPKASIQEPIEYSEYITDHREPAPELIECCEKHGRVPKRDVALLHQNQHRWCRFQTTLTLDRLKVRIKGKVVPLAQAYWRTDKPYARQLTAQVKRAVKKFGWCPRAQAPISAN